MNICKIILKNGKVVEALETAQRCLSAELFEWFKATVMDHYLDFCDGVPPRLVCPCGQTEFLFNEASVTGAIEQMNAHLREMSRLRTEKASLKRQWMLHL